MRQVDAHNLVTEVASTRTAQQPPVLAVSDTIYVMHEGRVTGRLEAAEATEEKVMALATQ